MSWSIMKTNKNIFFRDTFIGLFHTIVLVLLTTSSFAQQQHKNQSCNESNKGIRKEIITSYASSNEDSILSILEVFYNPDGEVDSLVDLYDSNNDTLYNVYSYENERVFELKMFHSGFKDTIIWRAIEWNSHLKVTKYIVDGDSLNYYLFDYQKCIKVTKRYSENKLSFEGHAEWQDGRIVNNKTTYHSKEEDGVKSDTSISRMKYLKFNKKKDWLKRVEIGEDKELLQVRELIYY